MEQARVSALIRIYARFFNDEPSINSLFFIIWIDEHEYMKSILSVVAYLLFY